MEQIDNISKSNMSYKFDVTQDQFNKNDDDCNSESEEKNFKDETYHNSLNQNTNILKNKILILSDEKIQSSNETNCTNTILLPSSVNQNTKNAESNNEVYKILDNKQNNLNESNLLKDLKYMELSRYSWENQDDKQLFTKGCLWSPDGTCILTATNLDGMHIFELSSDIYGTAELKNKRNVNVLQSVVHINDGGIIYDYSWYPFMNSNTPETCCWLATRQHEPIHMWDAYTGELRCSYRGYDAVDEVEAAISVAFSYNGTKVLGGYKKSIKIFDTIIPGREYIQIDIKQPCSCFALHSSHQDVIATGSWKKTINMYDLRSPKLGSLINLYKHIGGVTFLKFSNNGQSLFSGARKDNQLIEWDMRNFTKPIRILKRNIATNQRIYFDLSPCGQWLISGDTTGAVHAWDIKDNFNEYLFPLHSDCCNGVSIHPTAPVLATSCGQHHFLSNEENSGKDIVIMYENSLIIWWYGKIIN